jgi:hypothetical protein
LIVGGQLAVVLEDDGWRVSGFEGDLIGAFYDGDAVTDESVSEHIAGPFHVESAGEGSRFAVSMSSTFVAGVGIWQFLRAAKSSRSSSFAPYWLRLLPVEIVHWHGSDEREERERDALSGKTITDYRKSGHLISLATTKTSVDFSCGHREVEIAWLASGDLDDDGLEDRLLLISTRATEGSALGIETFVASQSSTKPSRIVLRPSPEGNSVWH